MCLLVNGRMMDKLSEDTCHYWGGEDGQMRRHRHCRSIGALLSDDGHARALLRTRRLHVQQGAVMVAVLAAARWQARLRPLLRQEHRCVGQTEDSEQQNGKQSSHGKNSLDEPRICARVALYLKSF